MSIGRSTSSWVRGQESEVRTYIFPHTRSEVRAYTSTHCWSKVRTYTSMHPRSQVRCQGLHLHTSKVRGCGSGPTPPHIQGHRSGIRVYTSKHDHLGQGGGGEGNKFKPQQLYLTVMHLSKVNPGGPQVDPRILMEKMFVGQKPFPDNGFHCQNPFSKDLYILLFVVSEWCQNELLLSENPELRTQNSELFIDLVYSIFFLQ